MSDPTAINIKFNPTIQRMKGTTVHGRMAFDVPFISEIAHNLWQGGCEDGLILPDFIQHLVSLYPWESHKIRHDLDSVLLVRMYDSEDQTFEQTEELARWVNLCRTTGPVLVHCQAGLNRSSLVAARALMLDGMSAEMRYASYVRSGRRLASETGPSRSICGRAALTHPSRTVPRRAPDRRLMGPPRTRALPT